MCRVRNGSEPTHGGTAGTRAGCAYGAGMPPPRPSLVMSIVPIVLALALLAVVLPRAVAAGAPRSGHWRWPVASREVAGRFAYSPRHPFAAAQRRGIDVAAAPGATVRAPCGGRVSFAGPVPGGRGLGVTVRCGALVATHLGLGRLPPRRGGRGGHRPPPQ